MPNLKPKTRAREAEEEVEEEEEEEQEEIKPKQITQVQKEPVYIVQAQVPMQEVRQAQFKDGTTGIYLNVEEALTEILNVIKRLEKGLL